MSNRKTTLFYALLIALASLAVGMVLASRLGLAPESSAQTVAAPPANSAPLTGPLTATTFRDVAKVVSPAVVNIRTESRARAQDLTQFFGGGGGQGGQGQGGDLFERFFGRPQQQRPREQIVSAAGTGFIIDRAGYILTNNHVVEDATKIEVYFFAEEDQGYAARVIGRDPLTDSALIELTEKPDHALPEVKFGDSGQIFPGDWVMAIGNPFNLSHTVSVGIISAIGRPFPVAESRFAQVLQTDAAINPGNSGGPLLNMRGEVVGINTAIISGDSRQAGNVGIGFAIPINVVRELLPQLRAGKVTRGRIGVGIGAVPPDAIDEFGLKDRNGAVVLNIAPNSAAARAGIEPGDVITSYNGKPIRNRDELVAMVTATKPGTTVPVVVIRDKQQQTISVTVEELDLTAEASGLRGDPRPNDNGNGPVSEPTTGFGLTLGNITPQVAQELRLDRNVRGAVIMEVEPGSPAARVGLSEGDVITRVGRQSIQNAAEARDELARIPSGGTALMRVNRNGQETFVTVTKE